MSGTPEAEILWQEYSFCGFCLSLINILMFSILTKIFWSKYRRKRVDAGMVQSAGPDLFQVTGLMLMIPDPVLVEGW